MGQGIIMLLAGTAISAVIGIIAYFLKRTMSRGDKNEQDIQCLKDGSVSKQDFEKLEDSFSVLNDKFATKEEVKEIKDGMKKMTADIEYVKEKTVRSDDFIRVMTRLENKIDMINDRR